ncbi:MAG: alpha/beta fold hydrolase [Thermoanaerobaculia bacterium]|nr:alpha/beta fold hydrolase [Thermoanaerobaculia bacterium]
MSNPPASKSTIGRTLPLAPSPLRWLLGGASRLSPGWTSAWAARQFLRPRRRPVNGRVPGGASGAGGAGARRRDVSFEVDGVAIAATHWGAVGAARGALLVHGWEGRGEQLAPFAELLARRDYQGLTFDFPAHGSSGGSSTNFVEMAAVLRAAAERLAELRATADGVPRLDAVIAHSAGCVATLVARERGLDVDRLVFVASPADLGGFGDVFATVLGLSPEVRRRLQARIEQRIGVTWEAIAPERVARRLPPRPTLVLHDAADREVDLEHGRRLAAALAGSELAVTSGLGHNRILRDPEVLRQALEFLERASTRAC